METRKLLEEEKSAIEVVTEEHKKAYRKGLQKGDERIDSNALAQNEFAALGWVVSRWDQKIRACFQ